MFDRAEDNVVFVREPGNLFDPSDVKVGLRGQVCIQCLGYLDARVASIRPNKVDTLIPVSARMPWWTPLKIFIIAKKIHYFLFEP